MKKISIIIPVYNEEKVIEELVSRLENATCKLKYNFEFIFVDDGSKDDTLPKLIMLQADNPKLKIIKLSRNWGHQNAYNAGLDYVSGNAVVFMDGDLEDPPEVIQEFIKKWEEGFEVVYAVKETREESWFKKIMFSLFYHFLERFSNISVDKQAGMFSLIDEKVLKELRKCREKNKYYVGLRFFVGFKQAKITYHRDKRFAGSPKQTYRRLVNYALDALFAFSFLPIRLLTFFGIFVLIIITLGTGFIFFAKIFKFNFWIFYDLPGWSSIILLIFFVLGVQMIFMGVLGEYIARILDEVRNRPYYIVEEVFEVEKNSK
ncbi:MAG: glycosyltransferase family 2 protein [Candidatus Latescibacteria bacterium]|jgi:polyisoprenyl-phosphate glycosyltransferase|nr:glycosyltransferase family 2 protein [Candidatus Latescibacterota bacterium]